MYDVLNADDAGVSWTWKTDLRWAANCDFQGPAVLMVSPMNAEDCGERCFVHMKCTHFVWRNGACELKNLPDRIYEAPIAATAGGVCGVVNLMYKEYLRLAGYYMKAGRR
jgi:hypothetical protein